MNRWWIAAVLVLLALIAGSWRLFARGDEHLTTAPAVAAPLPQPTTDGEADAGGRNRAIASTSPRGAAPTVAGIDNLGDIKFRTAATRPTNEKDEAIRRRTWDRIETFVREGTLTDSQRRRLLADLYATSKRLGQLLDDESMQRIDSSQLDQMWVDLTAELENTVAQYLDEGQRRLFHALVPRGLVFQITVGDVLVDPEHPDAKGWTLDGDDVIEEDIYQGRPLPRG